MRKHLHITLLLAVFGLTAFSQSPAYNQPFGHKNSIQAELFGHGLFYSLNFERVILNGPRFKTTGQAGASYYPPETGVITVWMPLMINELFSLGSHHLEAGLGYVFTWERLPEPFGEFNSPWGGFFGGRLGYRYQKPSGRLVVRVGFTPFLEHREDFALHPSGVASVGYCF